MTTTFNRDQVLRLTRETLDHTLRFFNTVNENLLHVVENVRNTEARPMNLDEVTRICTDFHRQHETRMHELTGIWTNFASTVKNELPTTTPNLFDPNEVLRLNREMIDQTMRFFTTTNEALLKGQLPQHDQILPRNVIETITRAVSDFQKTQTELTHTFEQTFQKVLHNVTPTQHHTTNKTHETHTNTIHPQHAVRDEVFTLNREIIENTLRFFMNLNEHVVAIIENRDGKAIEQHTALINRIRDEFTTNHQQMITRFDGFIKRTAETLSTAHLNTTTIPNVPQIFDHQELLKINQDAIASTVKYFTTVTENILQVRGNNGETLIQATQEYQKHHQVLTSRLETIWRDTLTKATEIVTHNLTQVHGQNIQTPRHETKNMQPETREQTCCGNTHHTTGHNTTHHTHETPNHTETPKATTSKGTSPKTTKKHTSKH